MNAALEPRAYCRATSSLAVQSIKHSVRQMLGVHVRRRVARDRAARRSPRSASRQCSRSIGWSASSMRLRRRDGAHAQVDVEVALQSRQLVRELAQERRADVPGADEADRDRLTRRDRSRRARRAARAACPPPSTTTEMLRSDEPCAIARMFTPALPSALKNLRGDAGLPGHAVADDGEDAASGRHVHALNLPVMPLGEERALDRGSRARSAAAAGTAKQIECSELPCEIITTEMPSSRSAPNSRCAVPGTPIMPVPSRLSSAIASTVASPFTANADDDVRMNARARELRPEVLRMKIGSPRSTAGAIVLG